MKVIERRDPNTRRKRCEYCESLLEYSKEDIVFIDTEYETFSFYYITCPICNRKNRLNKKEII